jgi:DNA-binding transcriptional LysR family regulator
MTLNQLSTFADIARHLNLSHTSTKLHVSQSSITQKMKKLEEEFRTKLYQKSQRGIVLTKNGETFLTHVKVILKDIRDLTEQFGAIPTSDKPTLLRVGGSFAPSASFLPGVLATFRKHHPGIQLALKTHDSITLERMLLDHKLDVAILNHRPKSTNLIAEPYRRETLVVFASANHPLAKKRRISLRELARVPLIIKESMGATLIERLLNEANTAIPPNIVMRSESPAAVKTAVKNNMGLGVLFLRSVKEDLQAHKFKRLTLIGADLDIQTYIVSRRDAVSAVTPAFIDILRQRQKGNHRV